MNIFYLKMPGVHYYAGSVKKVFTCTLSKVIQSVFSTSKKLEVRNEMFVP